MTETERKALALVNEVAARERHCLEAHDFDDVAKALCRAIERHEAFAQEVSDTVEKHWGDMPCEFDRFIIAKPDPLVEALNDTEDGRAGPTTESYAACLRVAIEKRGGKIVWGEG